MAGLSSCGLIALLFLSQATAKIAAQALDSQQVTVGQPGLAPEGTAVSGGPQGGFDALRKAAEKGDPLAQNNLGSAYFHGKDVKKDVEEAARWFTRAAAADFAPAESNLAELYEKGWGVSQQGRAARLCERLLLVQPGGRGRRSDGSAKDQGSRERYDGSAKAGRAGAASGSGSRELVEG
jgi:TPR repeat protein